MSKQKIAMIWGVTGQDGSFLAELLLEKGYDVHGVIRRASSFNTGRIDHLRGQITLHYGDVTDAMSVVSLTNTIKPDEIYNLAAQSFVKASFEIPAYTAQVDAVGTLNIVEAMRQFLPEARFYQASTSELYGKVQEVPQKETTPFYPRSPYGVAKLYGFWITKNYRESYGLHISNGILFNHESERRGETFVTMKIVNTVTDIINGNAHILELGNINSLRDWGYAKDYVEGMWRMLQQEEADDYILSTNEMFSVRAFVELCFAYHEIEILWRGEGVDEVGYDGLNGNVLVKINPKYYRPAEVEQLRGDYSKAKDVLGWEPKVDVPQLVNIMMNHADRIPDHL